MAHEHAAASHDEIAFDQGSEAHAPGAIPEHSHATTTSIKPPLEACDLAYAYPRQEHSVFSGLSFHVHPASMLAILGNNGAGKSTLLDLLAGITKPTAGRVLIDGEDASVLSRKEMARRIAYVAQQQTVPHLSVYDEVLLARLFLGRSSILNWSSSANVFATNYRVANAKRCSSRVPWRRSRTSLSWMSLPARSIRRTSLRCSRWCGG